MASMNSDDDGELCLSHTPSHQSTQRTLYDDPTVWRKGVSECGKFGMCARVSAFRIQRQWESAWKLKGNAISLFTSNNSDKTVSPFEFARHSIKSHFRFSGRTGAEGGKDDSGNNDELIYEKTYAMQMGAMQVVLCVLLMLIRLRGWLWANIAEYSHSPKVNATISIAMCQRKNVLNRMVECASCRIMTNKWTENLHFMHSPNRGKYTHSLYERRRCRRLFLDAAISPRFIISIVETNANEKLHYNYLGNFARALELLSSFVHGVTAARDIVTARK